MNYLLLLSIFIKVSYAQGKTICGETDDRTLSYIKEVGRAADLTDLVGCTVTLISKNCAITAGHCLPKVKKFSFNVPQTKEGKVQESQAEDIYLIDPSFIKYKENGEGDDWAVIKLLPNNETGLYPGNVQGYLPVQTKDSVKLGQRLLIAGYGSDITDPDGHFSQQVHHGSVKKIGGFFSSASRIGYDIDTMGGNSGSSLILEDSQEIIGVHSHGTCEIWGPYNEGTLISKNKKFKEAISACLSEKK